jgi:hypothetical protein
MCLGSLWVLIRLYVQLLNCLECVHGILPRFRGKLFCSCVFERVVFLADFDFVYIAGFSKAADLLPAMLASEVCLVMTKEVKLRNCAMRDALPGARAAS